jgi:hypothetical protein
MWSGYGLAASNGTGRNSRNLIAGASANGVGKSKASKKKAR